MSDEDFQGKLRAEADALAEVQAHATVKPASEPVATSAQPAAEASGQPAAKTLRLKSFLATCGFGPEKQAVIQYYAIREGHKILTIAEWAAYAAAVLSRNA